MLQESTGVDAFPISGILDNNAECIGPEPATISTNENIAKSDLKQLDHGKRLRIAREIERKLTENDKKPPDHRRLERRPSP